MDEHSFRFDREQLSRLITDLHLLTGIWVNIFDSTGRDMRPTEHTMSFCRAIHAESEGRKRCEHCDMEAVAAARESGGLYRYRCHAGICENILPVFAGSSPIAYFVFGQMLDGSSVDKQWEHCLSSLGWYQGDLAQLRRCFYELKQFSTQEMDAFADLLQLLSSRVRPEDLISAAAYSDQKRLELYLARHYTESLSLKIIANELHMGTTKLCALAKQLSGGKTLSRYITDLRIETAKRLLRESSLSVSDIAETVGFSDDNYFSRVFKASVGLSPAVYRKQEHRNAQSST